MKRNRRLRGLFELVTDVVEHGSRAVEQVRKATAARPFDILAQIPPLAAPSALVRIVHDASVSGVYGSIRLVKTQTRRRRGRRRLRPRRVAVRERPGRRPARPVPRAKG